MSLTFSTGCVKKMADTSPLKTLLNLCFIDVYSGSQPTLPDNVPNGTKLVTIYSDGAAVGLTWNSTAPGGVLSKNSSETWSGTILATGTAGWFRIREAGDAGTASSSTAVRIDGTVATSGADMNLGSLSLVAAAPFAISAGTITLPQS